MCIVSRLAFPIQLMRSEKLAQKSKSFFHWMFFQTFFFSNLWNKPNWIKLVSANLGWGQCNLNYVHLNLVVEFCFCHIQWFGTWLSIFLFHTAALLSFRVNTVPMLRIQWSICEIFVLLIWNKMVVCLEILLARGKENHPLNLWLHFKNLYFLLWQLKRN